VIVYKQGCVTGVGQSVHEVVQTQP
jgi:hypothetical protein